MTAVFLITVVERVLKKHTQVKVPLPSIKCSVSRVKVLVRNVFYPVIINVYTASFLFKKHCTFCNSHYLDCHKE